NPGAIHKIWHDLLGGARGLILWDAKHEIVSDDATLGERGKAYAPVFAELRGGIARVLMNSEPHTDPIAILYSPASFRTQWMVKKKTGGDAWMQRDAAAELGPTAAGDEMWAYERAVTHLGLQPVYLTSLRDLRRFRTLILPHAVALSPTDARAIREFGAA